MQDTACKTRREVGPTPFTLYMKYLPKSTTVLGVVLGNTVNTRVYLIPSQYCDANMYCIKYQN